MIHIAEMKIETFDVSVLINYSETFGAYSKGEQALKGYIINSLTLMDDFFTNPEDDGVKKDALRIQESLSSGNYDIAAEEIIENIN